MSFRPNLLKALLVGAIIFIFSFLIRFASIGTEVFNNELYIFFLSCMLYSVVLYVVNVSLFQILDRVFIENRFAPKRIVIGFISSFFVSFQLFNFHSPAGRHDTSVFLSHGAALCCVG